MRIIQAIHSAKYGGAENLMLTLSKELQRRNHDVLVLCPRDGWVASRCQELHLSYEPLSLTRESGFKFRTLMKFHQLIQRWHADIVHAHQIRPSQYAGYATFATHAIPVCTIHSTDLYKHLKRIKKIIAVCDAVAENLRAHQYSASQIVKIYNGVPDAPIANPLELRKYLGIPPEQMTVVCTGRFLPVKGQDLLIKAAEICKLQIHFYFLGDEKTIYGLKLKNRVLNNERIHFLGMRNDVRKILPAFDICAAPSRREAFSLSLLEASSAGLPLIATNLGGNPELINNGSNGILVPPEKPEALAQAIMKLAEDSGLRKKMGRAARERYEQNFTIEKMTDQVEALYRELAGSR
jgi:glycosyltransferase involved in cell wall biosynthesis